MKIEDLSVAVRPRPSWEAIDLGFVMVRQWWRQIYGPWIFVLTLALLPLLLLGDPFLVILGLWWFRPLLSRVVLFVLSREMFGVPVDLTTALKAVPSLMFRLPWLLRVTVCRFTIFRGVLLPVWMLEGVKGRDRSRRESLIRNQLTGPVLWVTLLFLLFEWVVLWFGCFYLCIMLVPEELNYLLPNLETFADHWLGTVIYFLIIGFLEPFYIAVCFSLYLNCRTILEGWDLELSFRRIAERLAEEARRFSLSALVVLGILLNSGQMVHAQEKDVAEKSAISASNEEREQIRQKAEAMLSKPPFDNGHEQQDIWRLRFEVDDEGEEETPQTSFPNQGGSNIFGTLIGYLMWAVAIIVLIALIVFLVTSFLNKRGGQAEPMVILEPELPTAVMHQLIGTEPLPENIPQAARAAFASGDQRKALSYLFRGALLHLAESGKLDIADFATEGECLGQVKRKLDQAFSEFFEALVGSWQRVAYGHRTIEQTTFDHLVVQWDRHLGVKV